MLSEQEKSEIRASYKNAIDPRQHVKILMQLYLVSREEILDILGPLSKSARPKPSRKRPAETHLRAGVQGRGNAAPALRRIFPAGG
ncbi:MAG: hypothetical protein ACLVEX_03885 [Ruthenibacterium lactatiformans]